MFEWLTVILVVIVMIANFPAVRKQWREDRAGFMLTLRCAAGYLGFNFVGAVLIYLLITLRPPTDGKSIALIVLTISWFAFSLLWLIKLVPHYRHLPHWFDPRFGRFDAFMVALIAASAFAALIL